MKATLATLIFLLPQASHALTDVTMDYVYIGNTNNATDPATGNRFGSVAYPYKIGKFEVTNEQYTKFLNAIDPNGLNPNGVYNSTMGSHQLNRGGILFNSAAASGRKYTIRINMGDKPVNYVSWYDAARFTNWLHNGQGSSSTETGAYTLNGSTGVIIKNTTAKVWLPSEDEWYKAAYYDPTLNTNAGGYWLYPTQSNNPPTVATADAAGVISNPGANVANYNKGALWNGPIGNLTTVGSAQANNYYQTMDQAGNVYEWNDMVLGSSRGIRGGDYGLSSSEFYSGRREYTGPSTEKSWIGFRVASSADPYAEWAGPSGYSLATSKSDDEDQDGVTNFMEFALNSSPADASERGLYKSLIQESTSPTGRGLTLVVAVRRGAVFQQDSNGSQSANVDGVLYTIQGSLDLVNFSSIVSHLVVADIAPPATGLRSLVGSDWEYHTFRLAASMDETDQGFLRITAIATQ